MGREERRRMAKNLGVDSVGEPIEVTADELADILERGQGKITLDPLDDTGKGLGLAELGNPGIDASEESRLANGAVTPEMRDKVRAAIKGRINSLLEGYETKEPFYFESLTVATAHGCQLRIRRKETELPEYEDAELKILLNKIPAGAMMSDIIKILSTVKRLVSIEFLGPDGGGTTVYFGD